MKGRDSLRVTLRTNGVTDIPGDLVLESGKKLVVCGKQSNQQKPFVGMVIPEGNMSNKLILLDNRLNEMD